jgi:hypothetical protein
MQLQILVVGEQVLIVPLLKISIQDQVLEEMVLLVL